MLTSVLVKDKGQHLSSCSYENKKSTENDSRRCQIDRDNNENRRHPPSRLP